MKIHMLASWKHYVDHILPVWNALPDDVRGSVFVTFKDEAERVAASGVKVTSGKIVIDPDDKYIIAGYADIKRVPRNADICLMEHGSGQTYANVRSGSYAGGRDRGRVGLFIVPNERVASVNMAAYPDATTVAAGSPRLDALYMARLRNEHKRTGNKLAVSFHWRCVLCPETNTAFDEWKKDIVNLACTGNQHILGHGHPRLWEEISDFWKSSGIEPVQDWLTVVRRADVYACDNSSTMFEAAAIGLPVVLLNSRRWRRDVDHGLRFWDEAGMGPNLFAGDSIIDAVNNVNDYSDALRATAERTYTNLPDGTGTATTEAVDAIVRWAKNSKTA